MQSFPVYPTAAVQSQVSGAVQTPLFIHAGMQIAVMLEEIISTLSMQYCNE